jgi:hypothetical protein
VAGGVCAGGVVVVVGGVVEVSGLPPLNQPVDHATISKTTTTAATAHQARLFIGILLTHSESPPMGILARPHV